MDPNNPNNFGWLDTVILFAQEPSKDGVVYQHAAADMFKGLGIVNVFPASSINQAGDVLKHHGKAAVIVIDGTYSLAVDDVLRLAEKNGIPVILAAPTLAPFPEAARVDVRNGKIAYWDGKDWDGRTIQRLATVLQWANSCVARRVARDRAIAVEV